MSQVSLTVKKVTVATKEGVKRMLLTLEDPDGNIDAIAAQITEDEQLDIELPTHAPPAP